MENFSVIFSGNLTGQDTILFEDKRGCIVKNLMIQNTTQAQIQVNLSFDDVPFVFELQANEYKRLDMLPFTQKINGSGDGTNIHISGLEIA